MAAPVAAAVAVPSTEVIEDDLDPDDDMEVSVSTESVRAEVETDDERALTTTAPPFAEDTSGGSEDPSAAEAPDQLSVEVEKPLARTAGPVAVGRSVEDGVCEGTEEAREEAREEAWEEGEFIVKEIEVNFKPESRNQNPESPNPTPYTLHPDP